MLTCRFLGRLAGPDRDIGGRAECDRQPVRGRTSSSQMPSSGQEPYLSRRERGRLCAWTSDSSRVSAAGARALIHWQSEGSAAPLPLTTETDPVRKPLAARQRA